MSFRFLVPSPAYSRERVRVRVISTIKLLSTLEFTLTPALTPAYVGEGEIPHRIAQYGCGGCAPKIHVTCV
jgi:hypothetical protein